MRRRDPVTLLQVGFLLVAIALAIVTVRGLLAQEPARAQGPGGPFGGPPERGGFPGGRGGPGGPEVKLVDRFDRNKDGRLDAEERKAARTSLDSGGAGFRPRGFGGRGGPRDLEPAALGRRLSPADVTAYTDAPLYDLQTLRTIFLQFDDDRWEQELAAFHNTDVEIPATVVVDGRTYPDVGVGFRGASSFMMVPEGSKRSFNLSFDFVHGRQALHGYRTLNLLNANGDPTFVRGVLYSEIARAYIPAPKASFVRVVINGESWGLYVNTQQYNRDFLRDFFNTDTGARWKVPGSPGGRGGMEYLGEDVNAYKRLYEIKSKDDAKAWADLVRLFRVLNETPAERLEAALSPLLDIDGVLRFLALDVALVNSDGYWARASDYNIYQDPSGRFHVIPHDMNEALSPPGGPGRRGRLGFGRPGPPPGGPPPDGPPPGRGGDVLIGMPPPGGRGFGGSGTELDPLVGLDDPSKPLRSRLLAVPALRQRYLSYVRDIAGTWLDWRRLEPMVAAWQALIDDEVKQDTRKLYSYEAFRNGLQGEEGTLRAFIERRREFLLNATRTAGSM